jgi:hypothetical protein
VETIPQSDILMSLDLDVLFNKFDSLRDVKTMTQQTSWTPESEALLATSGQEPSAPAEPSWDHNDLAGDLRWQLAQRIVGSASFGKSALLSKFLLYVCDRALSGKTDEISEYQIGIHVFGRRPGYSPGEDNIVRNYARQLRQRLDNYFEVEGKFEALRLSIPRGKYVPLFSPNQAIDLAVPSDEDDPGEPLPVPDVLAVTSGNQQLSPETTFSIGRTHVRTVVYGLIALAICGAAVSLAFLRSRHAEVDSSRLLWAQIFDKDHMTLLVPADDGIVMIQNLTHHSVSLAEYISRDYLSVKSPYHIDAQNMADLDAQRYTSVADLESVLKFSRLPEAAPDHFAVRYARELHMEDLKDSNAVLLGSAFSNPWVELFQKNLNFEFSYQPHPNESVIINRQPMPGESPEYVNDAAAPSHLTYAVIALVPNLNDTGWVLIVEGLTMAGTQAAGDVLFNGEAMQPFLDKAESANGSLKPFELLIETRSFGSNAPQAKIIASRVYSKFPA